MQIILVILSLLSLWIISFIYTGFLLWNPWTVINPILLFIFYITSTHFISNAIKASGISVKKTISFLVIILTLITYGFSWLHLLIISQGLSLEMVISNPGHMLLGVEGLFNIGIYKFFGIPINGIFYAIFWVLEAGIFILICYTTSLSLIHEDIYCSTCNHWIKPIKGFITFGTNSVTDSIRKFRRKDFSFLSDEPSKEYRRSYYTIDAWICQTCSNSNFLALNAVLENSESTDNTTISKKIKIDTAELKEVYSKSEHWFNYAESGKYHTLSWMLPFVMLGVFAALSIVFSEVLKWDLGTHGPDDSTITFSLIFIIVTVVIEGILFINLIKRFQIRSSVQRYLLATLTGVFAVLVFHSMIIEVFFHSKHSLLAYLAISDFYEYGDGEKNYIMVWALIISTAFLATPGFASMFFTTSEVYCEKCHEWTMEEKYGLIFHYPDNEKLLDAFKHQDTSFLQKVRPIKGHDNGLYKLEFKWCNKCDKTHTISLKSITKYYKGGDRIEYGSREIFNNVIFLKENFDVIKDFAKRNAEVMSGEKILQ